MEACEVECPKCKELQPVIAAYKECEFAWEQQRRREEFHLKENEKLKADIELLIDQAETFDVLGRDEAYAEVDRLRAKIAVFTEDRYLNTIQRVYIQEQNELLNIELDNLKVEIEALRQKEK